MLNISHSGTGTNGFLVLSGISIPVRGTYATYSKLLFMQNQQSLSVLVYGNNLTTVAVNMYFNTSLYMVGVIGLTTDLGTKTCVSELRRTAGMCIVYLCTKQIL